MCRSVAALVSGYCFVIVASVIVIGLGVMCVVLRAAKVTINVSNLLKCRPYGLEINEVQAF